MTNRLRQQNKRVLRDLAKSVIHQSRGGGVPAMGIGSGGMSAASLISSVGGSETAPDANGNTLSYRMFWGDNWGSNWSNGT